MAAATRTRRRPTTPQAVSLREDFHSAAGSPLRVDEEAGIIYGIKIIGWESANRRRYLPEAVKDALAFYEGAKCYTDHPDGRATAMREMADLLGMWHSPVMETDGARANLHYLKSHPMAARVVEDAKRGLGLFGASHNADGVGETKDGVFVVGRITEVRSVDLVTDPATVSNLWEGRRIKVKASTFLLEKCLQALSKGRQKRLKALCEEMGDQVEMEADEAGDHRDHLYNAMRACEESDPEMAGKIHKLLGPDKPDEGDDDPASKGGDPLDDGVAGDAGKKKAEEGKKPKAPAAGATGLTEARAKALCKLAGMEATAEVLEAVKGATEDQAIAILNLAKKTADRAGKTSAPRSQGQTRPVTEGKAPKDAAEQAAMLLR